MEDLFNKIWDAMAVMMIIIVIVAVIVVVAMSCDFVSGIYKAKLRGEATRSKAMRKSVTKFLCYEGAVIIAGCIDLMICLTQLMTLIDVPFLRYIPFVTLFAGILISMIEIKSIKEKATEKEQRYLSESIATISAIIGKEDLIKLLTNKIKSE